MTSLSQGTAFDRVVDALTATTGHHPKGNDRQRASRCPAHDDHNPSLSVTRGTDRVLIKCQAGCDTDDVLAALNLNRADLYDEPLAAPERATVIAAYDYVDEHGAQLFQVCRLQPKTFRQRRMNGSGKWSWKLGDTRRVLYRLPAVLAAASAGQTIYIVEGEKDVHAVEAAGAVATTNPGGAGKWRPEYAQMLKGAKVIVVADRDEPGRKHAEQILTSLHEAKIDTRLAEPTAGKDIADHLAAGRTLDDLRPVSNISTDPPLHFRSLAQLCVDVDAAGPRQWLVRGWWPAGSYGVHAAEWKAQKTWNALDLAVSVASGTPWLGTLPVDAPGPVLVFAGEGGDGAIVRRLRAIATSRKLHAEDLPITVCTRAPHLSDETHLALMAAQLETTRPRLVILDPFYLSAGGADGKDLYAMGKVLERPQHMCARVDAALLLVTHFNRSRDAKGATRITGAGPAEWGRVLIGGTVITRHTHPLTKATTVLTELEAIGGEIPEMTMRVRRVIRAEDPEDLDSPLHYSVDVVLAEAEEESDTAPSPDLPPAARKLLEVLRALGRPSTARELVDKVVEVHGHGLRRETVSRTLNSLLRDGLVDCIDEHALEKTWTLPPNPVTGVTVTRDVTGVTGGVIGVTAPIGGHAPDHRSRSHHHTVTPEAPDCPNCHWPTDSTGHLTNCEDQR